MQFSYLFFEGSISDRAGLRKRASLKADILRRQPVKARSIVFAIAAAIVYSSTLSLWAQGGNSGSGSQPSAASAPSASQGSATIENQMIAYEVLRQMAGQIAERVKAKCNCSTVLLPDPNSQSEIITAKAFDVSAKALVDAYQASGGKGAPPIHADAFAPTLSDVAALFTAIKSSAVYSNQNFQPTAQSMITLLSIALSGEKVAVRTTNLPGDLDVGVKAVQEKIGEIEKAQKDAKGRIQQKQDQEDQKEAERQKNSKDKDKETKDKDEAAHKAALADIAADKSALADLDKEFSGLRTALGGTSADGTVLATIIKGKALLNSAPYSLLTVSVDGAGGDTKVTHFFWRELIMPTPSPSYNGGAVVSFLLTDQNANYQDGDVFHYMYGWSKWKNPKLPNHFDPPPNTH